MRLPLSLVLVGALLQSASAEPSAIFLVRHAERADAGSTAQKDPNLSATGSARAQALAATLCDAKISAVYTTEFHRTQETAQPLADKLGLQPQIVPAKETGELVAAIQRGAGNVLVVGHSNTLPEIMRALGIPEAPTLGEHDYDDLFVILREPAPRLLRLHLSLGR